MAIQTFTHPPGSFQATQFDGHNFDEVIELVGEENILEIWHGEPVIDLGGGNQDTLHIHWWVSKRDGSLVVSSRGVGEAWVPVVAS